MDRVHSTLAFSSSATDPQTPPPPPLRLFFQHLSSNLTTVSNFPIFVLGDLNAGSVTIFSDFCVFFLREQKMAVARASVADIRPDLKAWPSARPGSLATFAGY